MKLSFKRDKKETGLAAIANPYASVRIKADKKEIGYISPPSRFGNDCWKVHIAEKNDKTNCNWVWRTFKFEGKTEEESREFVKKYWDMFCEKYDFYYFDNDN